jgi:hypothetical protein
MAASGRSRVSRSMTPSRRQRPSVERLATGGFREGFRMPARRERWLRKGGRRTKATEEGTRGKAGEDLAVGETSAARDPIRTSARCPRASRHRPYLGIEELYRLGPRRRWDQNHQSVYWGEPDI